MICTTKLISRGGLALVLAAGLLAPLAHANLIYNDSFEIVGPNGPSTTYTGFFGGPCAADGWEVFNNQGGTTRTNLVPTTLPQPGAGQLMLHFFTTEHQNEVSQQFAGGPGNGPANANASVWVYVLSGQVFFGTGDGGNTGPNTFSTTHEQWELLQAPNGNSPVNTIVLGSWGGSAEFYADLVDVEATPEPATLGLLALGLVVVPRRRG